MALQTSDSPYKQVNYVLSSVKTVFTSNLLLNANYCIAQNGGRGKLL